MLIRSYRFFGIFIACITTKQANFRKLIVYNSKARYILINWIAMIYINVSSLPVK